ncbi:MAG: tetratricopeptide repeat protein [Planctomycetota bacterium]
MKLASLTLACVAATIALPAVTAPALAQQQQQQQQQGPALAFVGDGLRFEIWGYDKQTSEIGGYIIMGQNQFPYIAKLDFDTGRIVGKFAVSKGEAYDFDAQLAPQGEALTFRTGAKTYNLVNVDSPGGQSQQPNNQPPADPNPLDPNSGGGNTPSNNNPPNNNPPSNNNAGGAPAQNAVEPDFDEGFAALQRGDGQLAYQHLEPFAMRGDVDAARLLGVMFHYGKAGMPVDGAAAAKFYKIAADQNDPQSLGNLGVLHRDGIGVPRDGKLAADYLSRAANLGEVAAQFSYGELFWVGDLVDQDDVEAIAWWMIASESGSRQARDNLSVVRREVEPELMQKAESRAKELRAQIAKIQDIDAAAKRKRTEESMIEAMQGLDDRMSEIESMFEE